jgi:hypothetical protein
VSCSTVVTLRLMSAPHGESAGWIDFHVESMLQTAGRPIANALALILGEGRLLTGDRAIASSRCSRTVASTRTRSASASPSRFFTGCTSCCAAFRPPTTRRRANFCTTCCATHPDQVYRALLTVTLRLVFLLYAEERDMLPDDETFGLHYSLGGLYQRLREDAALFPDTMNQRFGAWAQLLALFRIVHDGAEAGALRLPARHGVLFDPDRFKFLEGRTLTTARQIDERIEPPLVPDGTVYRVLEKSARPRRRAHLVPRPRRRTDRLRVRDDDGLPARARDRPAASRSSRRSGMAPRPRSISRAAREAPADREKWFSDMTTASCHRE